MTVGEHLMIAPIVVPAVIAPTTMLLMRRRRVFSLWLSFGGCAAMLAAAIALFVTAQDDAIRSYALGGWAAPFGIVLVLDRLAAIMLVLAALLGPRLYCALQTMLAPFLHHARCVDNLRDWSRRIAPKIRHYQ